MRSCEHPWGFPWLSFQRKGLLRLANNLAEFAISAAALQVERRGALVFEQPEDLGATGSDPWCSSRPANM